MIYSRIAGVFVVGVCGSGVHDPGRDLYNKPRPEAAEMAVGVGGGVLSTYVEDKGRGGVQRGLC